MPRLDRRLGLLLVSGVALLAISIPVLAASPSPSGGPAKSEKPAKAEKGAETSVSLKGTVRQSSDADGQPTYTVSVDGKTWTLSAGPPWFWATRTRSAPTWGRRSRSPERPMPGTPRSMSKRSTARLCASRASRRGRAARGGWPDASRLEGLDGERQARQGPRPRERARSVEEGVGGALIGPRCPAAAAASRSSCVTVRCDRRPASPEGGAVPAMDLRGQDRPTGTLVRRSARRLGARHRRRR